MPYRFRESKLFKHLSGESLEKGIQNTMFHRLISDLKLDRTARRSALSLL
jgi:hypothetical protein